MKMSTTPLALAFVVAMGSLIGPLSSNAEAALLDLWLPKSLIVKPSFMTTADGTRIPVPPEQELLVQLRLDTASSYGNPATRLLKSKVVKDGIINLEIETSAEKACRKESGGMLAMMGPHSVDLKLALAPRTYLVVIDGSASGQLVVSETGSQFISDPAYAETYTERATNALAELMGEPTAIEINGANGCEVKVKEQTGKLVMSYVFPSRQETLRNGDILLKKERAGELEIRNHDVRMDCEESVVSYRIRLLGPNRGRDGQISFSVTASEPGLRKELSFTADELACAK
jgi:hypothetical protein